VVRGEAQVGLTGSSGGSRASPARAWRPAQPGRGVGSWPWAGACRAGPRCT